LENRALPIRLKKWQQESSTTPNISLSREQQAGQTDQSQPPKLEQDHTAPGGFLDGWRSRWEARQRAIIDGIEIPDHTVEKSGNKTEKVLDSEGSLADSSEGRGTSEDEENPLVRTQPGFVFDKRVDKERRRNAMDDFIEEKHRRRREQRMKEWKRK
jgi:hypothetical protein